MKRRNLLLAGLLSVLVSCGGTPADTRPQLVVGLECNYAPFNWTQNKKTSTNYAINGTKTYAEGYDVQIAKKIADELDMKLVIKKVEWDALIPNVQTGLIDLIIAGMSPTPSRLIDIDFTSPYYTSEHVLLVKSNNAYASVTSVNQLEGARIAGQIGTLYDDIAHAIPGVVIGRDAPTVPEIITYLQQDLIDGTVLELPVAQGLVAEDSSLTIVRFDDGQGFTHLIDEDTNEARLIEDSDRDVAIGLAKGRDELKNSINTILDGISVEERNQLMMNAVNQQA